MEFFDTSYLKNDCITRARHGLTWTLDESRKMRQLFIESTPLDEMANTLMRPALGVVLKLRQQGYIRVHAQCPDAASSTYTVEPVYEKMRSSFRAANTAYPDLCPNTQITNYHVQDSYYTTQKEVKMSATIEIKTMIDGRDGKDMSDREIFSFISKLEDKVETLRKIKVKSEKLHKLIEDEQRAIDELAKYVDTRADVSKSTT